MRLVPRMTDSEKTSRRSAVVGMRAMSRGAPRQ
jgi:hypothetical protein